MTLKVTIDGTELEVERGTTILQAAEQVGVEIPTFCYHEGLSAPANCRMCLVSTNKSNKLLPACYGTCQDGMEVTTDDERTVRTRKSTLEFILLHHPVDCPICDQAGECVLQDNYFNHSTSPSRLFTKKAHKPKAEPIGPNVMLDAERCIVCTRCVRFCEEITKTNELQVMHRGERAYITTFPGQQIDNDYATNVVDLCPVGALTSRDFRFKMRVWFLKSANSVCSGCSRGCNIVVDHGQGTVQRYRPRTNMDVNQWWMCDPGRLSYKELQQERLERATIDGEAHPVREVLAGVVRSLTQLQKAHGLNKLAIVPSLSATNEDLYALSKLSELAGFGEWYVGGRAPGKEDELLQKADKNPNRKGLDLVLAASGRIGHPLRQLATDISLGKVKGVLWIGHEHAADDSVIAAVKGLGTRIAFASNGSPAISAAELVLPVRTFEEVDGTWTNFEGRVQRISAGPAAAGESVALWDLVYRLAKALGHREAMPKALSIRQLSKAMAADLPAFADLTFDTIGESGRPVATQSAA